MTSKVPVKERGDLAEGLAGFGDTFVAPVLGVRLAFVDRSFEILAFPHAEKATATWIWLTLPCAIALGTGSGRW